MRSGNEKEERTQEPIIELDQSDYSEVIDGDILKKIAAHESDFSLEYFSKGAKAAYEMILNAFRDLDHDTLKSLLSNQVYQQFAQEMDRRTQKLQWILVSGPEVSIEQASIQGKEARIQVRFDSQEIQYFSDENISDSDADAKVEHKTNLWTFSKSLGASDQIWKLIKTQ